MHFGSHTHPWLAVVFIGWKDDRLSDGLLLSEKYQCRIGRGMGCRKSGGTYVVEVPEVNTPVLVPNSEVFGPIPVVSIVPVPTIEVPDVDEEEDSDSNL